MSPQIADPITTDQIKKCFDCDIRIAAAISKIILLEDSPPDKLIEICRILLGCQISTLAPRTDSPTLQYLVKNMMLQPIPEWTLVYSYPTKEWFLDSPATVYDYLIDNGYLDPEK